MPERTISRYGSSKKFIGNVSEIKTKAMSITLKQNINEKKVERVFIVDANIDVMIGHTKKDHYRYQGWR